MFERFTDEARQVVTLAQDESRRAGHQDIGVEHLLLSAACVIEREDDGRARDVLGVSSQELRNRLLVVRPAGDGPPPVGHIPFTRAAKQALERSLRASLELDQHAITVWHLLLGALDTDDTVLDDVLAELHIDRALARSQVVEVAEATPPDEPRPGGGGRARVGWSIRHRRQPSEQSTELRHQRDVLALALRRYGRHAEGCPAPQAACTCGLADALEIARHRGEGESAS